MQQQSATIRWRIVLLHIVVVAVSSSAQTEQSRPSPGRYARVMPADFLQSINAVRHANQSQSNNSTGPSSNGYRLDGRPGWAESNSIESLRFRRGAGASNLCKTQRCKCTSESNFMTVECPVTEDTAFAEHDVPQADTLLIKLSSDSKFQLRSNSFNQNRLNRVLIEGSKWGREQVVIDTNAFHGLAGPFPEIEIVNVHTVFVQPKAFYNEFKLNVSNCAHLTLSTEAFANATFHGLFEKIQDFDLMKGAFSRAAAKIVIQDSNLKKIQELHATLREIRFVGCSIDTIETNAFNVLKIDSIIFENCHIGSIQSNAFTEKLMSEHFALNDCQIDHIEKDAIAGSGIVDVTIANNSITRVDGGAITLHSINVQIQSNNFTLTEIFWFSVYAWSNVSIDGNHFGIYKRMRIENTKSPLRCAFENNFITTTERDSLNFKSPVCRIKQISFDRLCSCNSTYFTQLAHVDVSVESYCRIDRTLSHCFNATLYNVRAHEEDICRETTRIDCVNDRINAKTNGYFIDWRWLFNRNEWIFHFYIASGVILLALIVVLVVVIVRRFLNRNKNYTDGPTRDLVLMESLHPTTATLNERIYRDADPAFSRTDLLIIEKTLGDMKRKYPPEYYDQVHNNTQKLIGGYMSETEKVKTIAEIVQCVEECENTGCDFLAFTDILYNHLGSGGDMAANEILYTEPIRASSNAGYDHIYAEPQQQHLLKSEYTVPIDFNENNSHVYTEPLTGAIDYVAINRANANKPIVQFDPSHLYAQPSKAGKRQANPVVDVTPSTSSLNHTQIVPKTSHLSDKFKNSTHASSQESNSSQSDDSCASGITLPLDNPIHY